MKILATLTFILIASYAFSQTEKSSTLSNYSSDRYSIKYPSSWRIDTSNNSGTEFAIFSPKENTEDKFLENVNLIIQNLSGKNIDLDKYANLSENQIKTNAIDLKEFQMTKMKKGLNEYYKLTYEMTYGNFKLFTEQYYFIKDEHAYVITFSSEINKSKIAGEEILASFSLVK